MVDRSRLDRFSQMAKKEGRPARSIFKLQEIDRRFRLLRAGQHILDLGSAPGSWLQYAAERVGSAGTATGYDLKPISIALPSHAKCFVGDAFEIDPGGKRYDVVLSDMAPQTMGHAKTDAARSAALVERALDVAESTLRPGGMCVVKILEGGEVPLLVKRMRTLFEKVERARPEATRRESTELFLIGLRFRSNACD